MSAAPPPRRFRPVRFLFILFVLLAAGAAAVSWWGWDQFHRPGPLQQPVALVIEKGASLGSIAAMLEKNGVVSDRRIFMVGARLGEWHRLLRAGEFEFQPGMSMRAVVDHLISGKTVLRRVTVAEGLTTEEVLALVKEAAGLEGTVPADVPEGSLLPETYFYSWGDSRAELVGRMRAKMAETVAALWQQRGKGLAVNTPEEAVTLASIVEKETGIASERRLVAAVFNNRLRRGMRLQSDPTVAYAVTGGKGALDRPLTRDDLAVSSPYNTYQVRGLPPGPIANPGKASIEAALDPAPVNYLYFVADGSGGHVFSRTLAEHNRNVAKWRRLLRRQRTQDPGK